ncbi:hypothetical protein DFH07DRAFT_785214 [Mycena maculata]|uniref:Uncharacterized protein n=1 Tax=Mycena maculata TaxID=230809 RepID=A0AAD7HBY0_9AGAR|nr:hypothetical protein DFH07DRAFT_785214 [Mycena maculata]
MNWNPILFHSPPTHEPSIRDGCAVCPGPTYLGIERRSIYKETKWSLKNYHKRGELCGTIPALVTNLSITRRGMISISVHEDLTYTIPIISAHNLRPILTHTGVHGPPSSTSAEVPPDDVPIATVPEPTQSRPPVVSFLGLRRNIVSGPAVRNQIAGPSHRSHDHPVKEPTSRGSSKARRMLAKALSLRASNPHTSPARGPDARPKISVRSSVGKESLGDEGFTDDSHIQGESDSLLDPMEFASSRTSVAVFPSEREESELDGNAAPHRSNTTLSFERPNGSGLHASTARGPDARLKISPRSSVIEESLDGEYFTDDSHIQVESDSLLDPMEFASSRTSVAILSSEREESELDGNAAPDISNTTSSFERPNSSEPTARGPDVRLKISPRSSVKEESLDDEWFTDNFHIQEESDSLLDPMEFASSRTSVAVLPSEGGSDTESEFYAYYAALNGSKTPLPIQPSILHRPDTTFVDTS